MTRHIRGSSLGEEIAKRKAKKWPARGVTRPEKAGQTSAACKRGEHSACTKLDCSCVCGHR